MSLMRTVLFLLALCSLGCGSSAEPKPILIGYPAAWTGANAAANADGFGLRGQK
jgi:hypothetical protein